MTEGLRRPAGPAPLPWLVIASFALAIVGVTAFVVTSHFKFEGSYGEASGTQNVGMNVSFGNELGTGGLTATAACFVAGAVLGGLALRRKRGSRLAAAAGLALNALAAVLFVAFLVGGWIQGG